MLVELIEGVHGRALVRLSVAFMHHLIFDNVKLLSYWAGCHGNHTTLPLPLPFPSLYAAEKSSTD